MLFSIARTFLYPARAIVSYRQLFDLLTQRKNMKLITALLALIAAPAAAFVSKSGEFLRHSQFPGKALHQEVEMQTVQLAAAMGPP